MNKSKKTKKAVVAVILIAAIAVSGAFAYLSMRTGVLKNVFKIGSAGAQLIETFDGKTYEGKVDEQDDGFADALMSPGKTYDKTTKVKFTGSGEAYAYITIRVPDDESNNLVEPSGKRITGSAKVVTPNFDIDVIADNETESNKWYKISETSKDGYTEYVFGYTTKLIKGETTPTSPLKSVTVANLFINNNDFTSLKSEYLVPVTAYTIQMPDSTSVTSVWEASRYAAN